MILTVPNILSLLRLPLALLFLYQDLSVRISVLVIAMVTDGLDGYIARRYGQSSPLGVILDPLMDRFFAFFLIAVLMWEGSLSLFQLLILLSRDFSVMFFGLYLFITGKMSDYRLGAIWCGKASTFLQFIFFLAILFQLPIPFYAYAIFLFFGILALPELYFNRKRA